MDISGVQRQLDALMKRLPQRIGTEAVNYYKRSWTVQGWIDTSLKKWKKRAANKDPGRAILVKRGHLRRSIRITSAGYNWVRVGTSVKYARVHNEGFNGRVRIPAHRRKLKASYYRRTGVYSLKTRKERKKKITIRKTAVNVKAHTRHVRMPRRQFMGLSAGLERRLEKILQREFLKILR